MLLRLSIKMYWFHVRDVNDVAYMGLNYVIIGSDNGISPVRRQAIAWTNTDLLSIGPNIV